MSMNRKESEDGVSSKIKDMCFWHKYLYKKSKLPFAIKGSSEFILGLEIYF